MKRGCIITEQTIAPGGTIDQHYIPNKVIIGAIAIVIAINLATINNIIKNRSNRMDDEKEKLISNVKVDNSSVATSSVSIIYNSANEFLNQNQSIIIIEIITLFLYA